MKAKLENEVNMDTKSSKISPRELLQRGVLRLRISDFRTPVP